ncbi:hypothetical protein FPSE_10527 [Fusarium pseudograminearum CS3096]|uniref:Uncharacterized protein n=1 Tax=Fusarium pseudograminearum (strain CS3096) TaxID=1028729 RepID=K3V7V1_FUSPC|nr:hypothetical protein FPSE_10527 [Fusarium pseudograminearum CS3096]EKJ69274.1 hypothetical protein FPSE_10527 [Fusarium pseudograminearum CS3096]
MPRRLAEQISKCRRKTPTKRQRSSSAASTPNTQKGHKIEASFRGSTKPTTPKPNGMTADPDTITKAVTDMQKKKDDELVTKFADMMKKRDMCEGIGVIMLKKKQELDDLKREQQALREKDREYDALSNGDDEHKMNPRLRTTYCYGLRLRRPTFLLSISPASTLKNNTTREGASTRHRQKKGTNREHRDMNTKMETGKET